MVETPDYEHQFEHYLQGHFHPDVAPKARRAVRLGQVSMEGFLALADVFQANHEALDSSVLDGTVEPEYQPYIPTLFDNQLERTESAQLRNTGRQ